MSFDIIRELRAPAAEIDESQAPTRNWIMGKEEFVKRMPHHNGIEALWVTRWKQPVSSFAAIVGIVRGGRRFRFHKGKEYNLCVFISWYIT
jgi:hypothetical protein